jgi:transcriptional regulator with XRE-family HTH domain
MSTQSDASGTPRQREFGKWVSDMLTFLEDTRGMSLREVARKSGVSHTQIYRWMGKPASKGYSDPQSETVRQFCERLKLPYEEAAVILGWTKKQDPAPSIDDLEGKIRRAKLVLRSKSLTPAQREKYEGMLRDFEAAYERVIDTIIEDLERDEARGDE